jgi:hypothetical protein
MDKEQVREANQPAFLGRPRVRINNHFSRTDKPISQSSSAGGKSGGCGRKHRADGRYLQQPDWALLARRSAHALACVTLESMTTGRVKTLKQGGHMNPGDSIFDSFPPAAGLTGANDFQAGELPAAISIDNDNIPAWDDAWIDLGGEA